MLPLFAHYPQILAITVCFEPWQKPRARFFGSALMLVINFVNFRSLTDHLFGKELFIRFTASAFRKLLAIYVFSYFPFGFEGRMWDLIVSVPDYCLSFYFAPRYTHSVFVWLFWTKLRPSELKSILGIHNSNLLTTTLPAFTPLFLYISVASSVNLGLIWIWLGGRRFLSNPSKNENLFNGIIEFWILSTRPELEHYK